MSYVLGIDPSLTGLALCAFHEGDPDPDPRLWRFTSKPEGPDVYGRMLRYRKLGREVLGVLKTLGQPRLVFVEHYAFGKMGGNAMLDLAEFGGLLRTALCNHTPHVREVSPSTLKKFATGKGVGKKEFVMAHVAQQWGQIFESNDECDAYVLARMAAVAAGWLRANNQHQRDAAAEALKGVQRKEKKRKTSKDG